MTKEGLPRLERRSIELSSVGEAEHPSLMPLQNFNLLDAEGNFTGMLTKEAVNGEGVSPRSTFFEAKGEITGEILSHLTRNDKPFTYINVAASGTFVCPVNFNGRIVPDMYTKGEFLDHILRLEAGVIIQCVLSSSILPSPSTLLSAPFLPFTSVQSHPCAIIHPCLNHPH